MRLALGITMLAGCGRVAFDPLAQGGGDAQADAALIDAAPFGAPMRITELAIAGSDDEDPTLRDDLREMFFASDRPNGLGAADIWWTRRATATEPWAVPMNLQTLSSASGETTPKLTSNGLVMYFGSDRPGGKGNVDIWRSERMTVDSSWSTPVHVPELSSTAYDSSVAVSDDELVLVMTSERNAPGSFREIFASTRASTSVPWSAPVKITELAPDIPSHATDPWLSPDGLTIVFSTGRSGGAGDLDLWQATRPSRAQAFGLPVWIPGPNTAARERDPWQSSDGRTLVFASLATGDYDIYFVTR